MVPVIVLTGFLGSGKTTLLNRLFRARPPGRGRFAIIVNEFGDIGIDADLLPAEATRQVELPGGCICCQLVDDLKTTMLDLLDSAPDLECVIVETTGVADPMPISWTLAAEPLGERIRLAAVVTVVDPLHHEGWRGESPSVDAQVRYADLIVLSKLDETAPAPALLDGLRELNDVAPIVAEQPDDVAAVLWGLLDDPELATRARPDHGHAHPDGDAGFDSVGVAAPDTYDLEELMAALEELPPGVIRLKGIVRAVDTEAGATEPGVFVVHRVGARVSAAPCASEAPARVVAIGRDLDSKALAACLARAVLRSESVPVHPRAD